MEVGDEHDPDDDGDERESESSDPSDPRTPPGPGDPGHHLAVGEQQESEHECHSRYNVERVVRR